MYTAKVIRKDKTSAGIQVKVQFSNGADTFNEAITPQDRGGFYHWLEARLASLNTFDALDSELVEGQDVAAPQSQEPTQQEIGFQQWLRDFGRLETLQKLIDLGVVPADHERIAQLRSKVQSDLKLPYIDLL